MQTPNNIPLGGSPRYLFTAGGIGITAILANVSIPRRNWRHVRLLDDPAFEWVNPVGVGEPVAESRCQMTTVLTTTATTAGPSTTPPTASRCPYHAWSRLPGRIHNGHQALATSYLAGRANASKEQVVYAVETYGSNLPVAGETPLDSPVRGHLNGREWMPHITFHDAPRLMHRLSTACMIVILYLTGMRPGEALELRVGCCPEPEADGTRHGGYRIHGNYFKGARDADGKHVVGGLPRETPWTVIPPVVRAVRVLERMTDGPLLFPARSAWAMPTAGSRKRRGEALTCQGANARIATFTAWLNEYAAHTRPEERVPDDPHGPVHVNRFRRILSA